MIPVHMPPLGPSPSRNPFARPKLQNEKHESGSFSRATLLPSILSPVRSTSQTTAHGSQISTPADRRVGIRAGDAVPGSVAKPRTAWRLLWRGGLEIGREGWRLDGITFFAKLSFAPPTPTTSSMAKEVNPFDVPIQPFGTPSNAVSAPAPGTPTSPFPLTNGDTDLCLSLESMRGRKYLQVRGLVDLPEDEILEGEGAENEGGVQMSIAPEAALLGAYFTGLLCRSEKLTKRGRTTSGITIGLGDEDVGEPVGTADEQGVLRLCVGRRKPAPQPPSAKKVRPGEPLPRAPLFFPAKAPKKPPPLFLSRSLSRTSSLSSSIYLPPQPHSHTQQGSIATSSKSVSTLPASAPAPVSGRTPGRRGEKRPRKLETEDLNQDGDRKRKTGRIVPERPPLSRSQVRSSSTGMERMSSGTPIMLDTPTEGEEEDIFGKRASSAMSVPGIGTSSHLPAANLSRWNSVDGAQHATADDGMIADDDDPPNTGRSKRVRVPQQVLDNKATIRKQCLVLLETRGIPRTHESFKDVFGMATKGTYFAFRNQLEAGPVSKSDLQEIINRHLDMYLPETCGHGYGINHAEKAGLHYLTDKLGEDETSREDRGKQHDIHASPLQKAKKGPLDLDLAREVTVRDKQEEYDEVKLEGTFFHAHITEEGRVKLEAVEEEEEDE
ncbi:hypothetical protein I316_05540 [Kwoniella heveanensis BCC8398]|uniref:Sld7 C-terminal domain-containing protein n=1 Tax=Kwoniella heveanensis BCC8398 TaxID=1296120 RepID=A0A1B9GPH2_9TREE|nr:hypothetical protein I316_05540 [Kwoniella heveanensis BCC8398]